MAELILRMQSQLIGYSPAEYAFVVPDGLTPEEVARLHWEYNLRFLQAQEQIANEPVSEEQEKAIAKAATETLTEKLPATKVAEEQTEYKVGDTVTVAGIEFTKHSEEPWESKPEATACRPWQQKPKFDNLFG